MKTFEINWGGRANLERNDAFVFVFCAIASAWYAYYSATHSWFFGQDFDHLLLMDKLTFLQFLMAPIDIHNPLPLHRFFCWLVFDPLRMNFGAAMAILGLFHWIACVYFYLLLKRIWPGTVAVLLAGFYCTNFYVLDLFYWWSAGLHRFSYLALMFYACNVVLDYEKPRSLILAGALVLLAQLVSLCFFEKGIFLPLYLVLFLSIEWMKGRKLSTQDVFFVVVSGLVSALYVSTVSMAEEKKPEMNAVLYALFVYLKKYMVTIYPVLVNQTLEFFAAFVFLLGSIAFFVVWRLRGVVVFLLLAFGVVVAMFPIANSGRVTIFGSAAMLLSRYFHDNVFFYFVFLQCILLGVNKWGEKRWALSGRNCALLFSIVPVLYFGMSFWQSRHDVLCTYSDCTSTGQVRLTAASYVRNLRESAKAATITGEKIEVEDGLIPKFVYLTILKEQMHLSRVFSRYLDGVIFVNGSAAYVVSADGHIVKKG